MTLGTDAPHPARMGNYFLGGKDYFPADRDAAIGVLGAVPFMRSALLEHRGFVGRVVEYLAGEVGIRQFLDVGTGMPTHCNTHEVAQAIAPDARVVYVDNDPLVLAHARALLKSSPEGATVYVEADALDTEALLRHPVLNDTIDLRRPVGLLVTGLLHYFPGPSAYRLVEGLKAALAPGSHLAVSHATGDYTPPMVADRVGTVYRASGIPVTGRSRAEVARFFTGMELVEPGVVPEAQWRPASLEPPQEGHWHVSYGALGRRGH
ncbi:SAM-dependent methyltransferase [Allostreptomyces psammosilenae]|nr:SAM-dependent methyltransferase [Allostreptomyces psammosilenae]